VAWKLPTNVKDKGIKFKVIAQEAIEWHVNHERKDLRNFKSRTALIVATFGERSRMRSSLQKLMGGSANMRGGLLPRTDRYKNIFGKTY
jgi:hypothetical protein